MGTNSPELIVVHDYYYIFFALNEGVGERSRVIGALLTYNYNYIEWMEKIVWFKIYIYGRWSLETWSFEWRFAGAHGARRHWVSNLFSGNSPTYDRAMCGLQYQFSLLRSFRNQIKYNIHEDCLNAWRTHMNNSARHTTRVRKGITKPMHRSPAFCCCYCTVCVFVMGSAHTHVTFSLTCKKEEKNK